MRCDKKDLLLYAVTDRTWLGEKTLVQAVEESLKGGVTMVQLREKHLDEETFRREALDLQALCRRYGVPFLINDDVELAAAVGADGVHVGQHDMEAGQVREKIGPDKILGVSAQTVEQALKAQAAGADYLGVGDRPGQDLRGVRPDGGAGSPRPGGGGRLSGGGGGVPHRHQGRRGRGEL